MKKLSIGAVFIAVFCLFEANLVSGAEKIDINTASLPDLMKIIHIGEARARELISLRPFTSIDDLTRIKGIGESRVKDIKQQGLAWVDPLLGTGGEVSDDSQIPEVQITETKNSPEAINPKKAEPRTGLAAAGEQVPQIKSFSLVILLAALALAVFSGTAILVLKKTIK